eukprot:3467969-Rhodomonas_salina.3
MSKTLPRGVFLFLLALPLSLNTPRLQPDTATLWRAEDFHYAVPPKIAHCGGGGSQWKQCHLASLSLRHTSLPVVRLRGGFEFDDMVQHPPPIFHETIQTSQSPSRRSCFRGMLTSLSPCM